MVRMTRSALLAALTLGLVAGTSALALINPTFTPVHVAKQSALILELQVAPPKDGRAAAAVRRVLKGKCDSKTLTLDLTTAAVKEQGQALADVIQASAGAPAGFFTGGAESREGPGQPDAAEGKDRKAFLHIGGKWVALYGGQKDVWHLDGFDTQMLATWQGGSDMLLRAADYVLAEADADVPARENVTWAAAGPQPFGKVPGPVHAAMPVDLAGDGKLALLAESEGGDRLFQFDAKAKGLKDVTAAHALSAKSIVAAWGPFGGQGRLDLVSWDGQALTLHVQDADGKFRAGRTLAKADLGAEVLGLAVLDSGKPGRAAVLVSTKAAPLLWVPGEKDSAPRPLGFDAAAAAGLGAPGGCLVADLDGDGLADILQPFVKGSLVYKGKPGGGFAAPIRADVALGAGRSHAFLGDFDGDGLLDIVTLSEAGAGVWQNRGGMKFTESLAFSGELAYKADGGAVDGMTVDFNTDGRQDIVLFNAGAYPCLFFSRGFRSFGYANGLDFDRLGTLAAAAGGQQAGCMADFDGDGSPELAMVLSNGEGWWLAFETAGEQPKCVRAALPLKGPFAGPLTVTGWRKDRCLGAWNVVAGTSEALVALPKAGPVTLKWHLPGATPQTKEVALTGPARLVLEAAAGPSGSAVAATPAPATPAKPVEGAAPPDPSKSGLSILEINTRTHPYRAQPNPEAVRTTWRYWETWQTELVKLDSGDLVRADIFRPVVAAKDAQGKAVTGPDGKIKLDINKAKKVTGSALPPDGWRGVEFDDGAWFRHEGPMTEGYRSLALVCVRGKFQVEDPARAPELSLSVGFRGGLVAYVNGREVGRASLPAGELTPETPAEEYPPEVYTNPDGSLIDQTNVAPWANYVVTAAWAPKLGNQFKDPQVVARYQQRCRRLEVKVPASALRRGLNVLALEVHRAPTRAVMFQNVAYNDWLAKHIVSEPKSTFLGRSMPGCFWNHAMLEDVRLAAPADGAGLVPNVARPKGFQVWNESVFKRVLPTHYGDPNEPLRPIRIRGVRNGTASGQIVVGSADAIKGLKVAVSDLKDAAGHTMPASAVEVRYVRWWQMPGWPRAGQYDALDPEPPGDLAPLTKPPWDQNTSMGAVAGVVQPVWFVVQVPRDAPVGTYMGKVTVNAEGQEPVEAALELRVVSDWVLPDANAFTTYMGILESPDSVAFQYNVPLWSDAHWKLLDKTMQVLGDVSNREVYIPLITKTQLGNEHGMVRWIRQADGTYKHDFSLAERYLDLAVTYHWNVQVVCLYLSDIAVGRHNPYLDPPRDPPGVTVVDPATGALSEMDAPKWGTPESQAFWKPVVEGMRAILEKRSLGHAMMFGCVVQNQVPIGAVADLVALAPDVKWVGYTHWGPKRVGNKTVGQALGRVAWAWGTPLAVFWDPEEDPPHYNWKTVEKDVFFVAAPRAKAQVALGQMAELSEFRLTCETTLLGVHSAGGLGPGLGSYRGFGQVGADFWPVLVAASGKAEAKRLDERYVGWGSLGMNDTFPALLGAGRSAPAHSCRSQMLRESLQEAEARIYVQNALLDEALRAKLGAALAEECKQICDDRTREFFYSAVFFNDNGTEYGRVFNQERWDVCTERLYQAAGKVSKALGKAVPLP